MSEPALIYAAFVCGSCFGAVAGVLVMAIAKAASREPTPDEFRDELDKYRAGGK